MNWNYHKIIKGILKHDITYVKKFYHKYKKIIKRELKEESNLDQKVYNIIESIILEINDDCDVESDRFRFSALPLNSEDRKAIKRLREIITG